MELKESIENLQKRSSEEKRKYEELSYSIFLENITFLRNSGEISAADKMFRELSRRVAEKENIVITPGQYSPQKSIFY